MSVHWFYMFSAIALEMFGIVFLKLSRGMTELIPSILVFVFYAACLSLFSLALKKIKLSIAYAVWSGIGTTGTILIGDWWLSESITFTKAIGIGFIIVGVISLNLSETEH